MGKVNFDIDYDEEDEFHLIDETDLEEDAVYGRYSKADACPECYLIHKGECL